MRRDVRPAFCRRSQETTRGQKESRDLTRKRTEKEIKKEKKGNFYAGPEAYQRAEI